MENNKKKKEEIVVPVKRKRGRPRLNRSPKKPHTPKKRGRKPKNKNDKKKSLNVIKRKRGRKPKDRVYLLTNKQKIALLDNNLHQDSMVIHLPISVGQMECDITNMNNNNNTYIEKTILEYTPDISTPQPYDPPDTNYKLNSNEKYDYKKNNIILEKPNLNFNTKDIKYNLYENKKLVQISIKQSVINQTNSNVESQHINTNYCCWWCCHRFNDNPIGIPIKYVDNKFNVYGNFCSFNCALTYNFYSDSANKWDRSSLLHLLYKKFYGLKESNIAYAPEREFLKIFGGHMNIDEFRNVQIQDSTYKVTYPPITSIIAQLEETKIINNGNHIKSKNVVIPIDDIRIQKASNQLKLKRSKPMVEKNTLEQCMQLQTTKK